MIRIPEIVEGLGDIGDRVDDPARQEVAIAMLHRPRQVITCRCGPTDLC